MLNCIRAETLLKSFFGATRLDGRYRMDHAVTATQKTILEAFRMDDKTIRKQANDLAVLEKYDKEN